MSDYTTPSVSDEAVENLAKAINLFYTEISGDVGNINEMLTEAITKHYSVNHEPQIEFPFEKEYEYIKEKVNKSLASSNKKLDNFTHVFISGYLPNGKTIHPNSIEQDENGFTVSKYSQLYINGVPYTSSDYTCRAEEGGWEKLNVLIIGAPKMSPYNARLDADYADIPLKNFKMIVFDDLEEPVNPDINSFLAEDIDTLKYIGNFNWAYTGLCTLRRLEITKDIYVTGTMNCPCLKELIIPNVTNIPDFKTNGALVKLDISNVSGIVGNISNANLNTDLSLKCSSIDNFSNNKLGKVNVGDKCTYVFNLGCEEIVFGKGFSKIIKDAVNSAKRIEFNNIQPLTMGDRCFNNLIDSLESVAFNSLAVMVSPMASFKLTKLTELIFKEPITNTVFFNNCPVLSEQSCLNIINALDAASAVTVRLDSNIKTNMNDIWYCKKENSKYVSCTADDEGAVTQAAAIIAKGGTLA